VALILDLLYEDEDVLVLNKPEGLLVHPGDGKPEETLVDAIKAYLQTFNKWDNTTIKRPIRGHIRHWFR
jgi:23S rRNA-/tRNA-specific pseudouridylate synthase